MAFNLQTLKTRALTALFFVIVMLGGLLWNGWSFIILFTAVHFGCWYEFIKLVKKIYGNNFKLKLILGFFYITMPVLMMINLGFPGSIVPNGPANGIHSDHHYSAAIPCGIIFSMWINDTMAYLVGSLIGRTPFSKISPKKTWEGTLGGAILCITAIGIFSNMIASAKILPVKHWIVIAAICSILGTAGDLLESKIKRMADVKDSGSILPGHGGFLDRFDSLLIAIPFIWIYLELFTSYFIM